MSLTPKYQVPISIEQLIQSEKFRQQQNSNKPIEGGPSFCIYVAEDSDDDLTLEQICYLEAYPRVEGDADIYPDFIINNNLNYCYSGEQFEDVISNVLMQKPEASIYDFLKALNYYSEKDSFLDF